MQQYIQTKKDKKTGSNQKTFQHQAGSGLIQELAKRVYRSPMESFREVISNSIDEGSKEIYITLTSTRIVISDRGSGIQDINKFIVYGESVKRDSKGEIIGEKGLGKLSLLMLNEKKVVFLTNNGKEGMHITMDEEKFTVETGKADAYLKYKGT